MPLHSPRQDRLSYNGFVCVVDKAGARIMAGGNKERGDIDA